MVLACWKAPTASTGLDTTVTNMHTSQFSFTSVPAAYNTDGVLQYIVNQDGVIWQKDVGTGTAMAAYPAAPNADSCPGGVPITGILTKRAISGTPRSHSPRV